MRQQEIFKLLMFKRKYLEDFLVFAAFSPIRKKNDRFIVNEW